MQRNLPISRLMMTNSSVGGHFPSDWRALIDFSEAYRKHIVYPESCSKPLIEWRLETFPDRPWTAGSPVAHLPLPVLLGSAGSTPLLTEIGPGGKGKEAQNPERAKRNFEPSMKCK